MCFSDGLDKAVAVGVVRQQEGSEVSYSYVGIAIKEGGDGPDRFRVPDFGSESAMLDWCDGINDYPDTGFIAEVIDGNFHIRGK